MLENGQKVCQNSMHMLQDTCVPRPCQKRDSGGQGLDIREVQIFGSSVPFLYKSLYSLERKEGGGALV